MSTDEVPDAASAARAARLREQINKMASGSAEEPIPSEQQKPKPASPREFIQQRMRELDRK